MSNKKYTAEQKQQLVDAAKTGKNTKEIARLFNMNPFVVRNILCAAKRTGELDYIRKCNKRNYYNEPLVPPPPPETLTQREAKVYKGNYDSLSIPVIKFKTNQYQSIFDVRV